MVTKVGRISSENLRRKKYLEKNPMEDEVLNSGNLEKNTLKEKRVGL